MACLAVGTPVAAHAKQDAPSGDSAPAVGQPVAAVSAKRDGGRGAGNGYGRGRGQDDGGSRSGRGRGSGAGAGGERGGPAGTSGDQGQAVSPGPGGSGKAGGNGKVGGAGKTGKVRGTGRRRGATSAPGSRRVQSPSPAVVAQSPAPAAPLPAAAATPTPAAAVPGAAVPAPTGSASPEPGDGGPGADVRGRAPRAGGNGAGGDGAGPGADGAAGVVGAFGGTAPVGAVSATGEGAPGGSGGADGPKASSDRDRPETVTRTVVHTVRQAVEVVPGFVWALIGGLAAFSLLAAGASSLMAARARRLARQREALLADVGLLQEALLPAAPEQVAGALATAAYRPGAGAGAGGDFHDVFRIDDERLGLVVGRVSASGRRALGLTALIRHVLRAYLEAGVQPRNALQVGADVLEHHLGADYATVTLAVYDRATSELTYAAAGMPAPIVLGAAAFEPVTACAAAPIGMGAPTGTRQTTLFLPAGAAACLFTDGVLDARLDGDRFGYRRTWLALEGLSREEGAGALLDRVAADADTRGDDMAAVLLRVGGDAPDASAVGERRTEELELTHRDLRGERPALFLRDCGVPTLRIPAMVEELREDGERLGGVVLRVRVGPGVPEAETALRAMDVLNVPSAGAREALAPAADGAAVSAASRPSGG